MRNLRKNSITHYAYLAIKKSGKPLTNKEIFQEVSKSFDFKGSTPRATLSSILTKNGQIFKKIGKGKYGLYSYE